MGRGTPNPAISQLEINNLRGHLEVLLRSAFMVPHPCPSVKSVVFLFFSRVQHWDTSSFLHLTHNPDLELNPRDYEHDHDYD